MHITGKNILSCVAFLLILVLLLLGTSKVVQPKNNNPTDGMQDPMANGVLGEAENSLDLVFVGDSESYCAFMPLKFWQDRGIPSYVCSTSGQKLTHSLQFLHKVFDHQKPKIVVLETNAIFSGVQQTDVLIYGAADRFSVFQYHNRWKSLKPRDWNFTINYTYVENSKGYYNGMAADPADASGYMDYSEEVAHIPSRSRLMLERIVCLCEENGAKLILVSSPSTKNWNYMRHNAIAQFAEEWDLEYIDTNLLQTEIPIDWNTDTRDKGDHLNYYGAIKVSAYLADRLSREYGLEDKRGREDYASFDSALAEFKKAIGITGDL